jgi:hypothetical protein
MKHTTEEMIFAALVRQQVSKRITAKTLNMTDEEAAAFRQRPVNDLIEEVIEELQDIAAVIKKLPDRPDQH